MISRLEESNLIRYTETIMLVMAVRGQDAGELNKMIKQYRGMLFPEYMEDLKITAASKEALLKREFESGPMRAIPLSQPKKGGGRKRLK